MKKIVFLLLSIQISFYAIGQTKKPISEQQASIIFEKTKGFPENTELSIAFIKNGKVSYYGIKRINDTLELSNNSKSVFEIGSISKVFTSTLLANFVLDKKIKLSDPIQDYFNFPLKNKQITVLQLANHTSGLPRLPSNLNLDEVDQSNPYKDYSVEYLKKYLTDEMELDNIPGSTYEYSNLGAGILGYLMELHIDLTYEELLQKYIFSKYNMTVSSSNANIIKFKIVDGLNNDGNKTSNWDLNALVGAGGILSNVEDLSKFVLAQYDPQNKELELTRQSSFEIPKYKMKVGLAWNIIEPDSDHSWYMHNGGTGGYTSIMALDEENKNGIIILSNVSAFNKSSRNIDQLCLELMRTQY